MNGENKNWNRRLWFYGALSCNTLKTIDEIELKAVADINPEQLKDAPAGVKVFNSMEEMLKGADMDSVIISTPNITHLELVEMAAKAKKAIICEKPAAMSVKEFDQMTAVTRENNVHFTVHQQRRWDTDYCIMKEVYDKNMVGDVYVIKSQLYGFNGDMHDWHVFLGYGRK